MAAKNGVIVNIPQGALRGKKETTPYDEIYYSFQRIPYAKPPAGDLRFKAPQPAGGWTGIRDATKQGAVAPCIDMFSGGGGLIKDGDEDCLFINVYTKEVPKPGKKYPVLVWVHGGGYTNGTGNKDLYSPDYFMSRDIIVVSMNYRLGAFGFLSLQTPECPGNNGLKDIRLSLRWIQKNISHFGGDPDNVTIFGESAGASAVHYLMLSPSCKGLFKRAISQSGAAYNSWGYARHPRECAYLLAKRLGFNATNDEELLNFLKKAPVDDIILKSAGLILEIEGERVAEQILNFAFVPTREPESEDAFITNNPLTDKFQLDVPYITGITEKEMLMVLYSPKQLPQWKEDKDFQDLVPRSLNLEKDSELSLKIAKKVREFYFKNGLDVDGLADALSDIYFNHGMHQAQRRRITNPNIKSSTYSYMFTFESKVFSVKDTMSKLIGLPNEKTGTTHADDVAYLFITSLAPIPPHEKGTPEYTTMQRMIDFWVNFATTGKPTNEKSEIDWRPTNASEDVYLDIGKDLQLKKDFLRERMQFWDEIFKLAGFEE